MVFERHGQDLQQEVIFFFGCFCCRRNPWFFFVKGIYFGVLQPPGICETAPSHGSRPLRSRWTSPEVFRHLPSAREFGGCVPTLKAPTMPAKAELAAGAGHQGGTTWGVHHLETHCKYYSKILEVTYLSSRKEGIWNLSIPNDPYKALKRMVCKLLLNEDPQHITELFATAIHRHRPPDDLGTWCWGSSACWLVGWFACFAFDDGDCESHLPANKSLQLSLHNSQK